MIVNFYVVRDGRLIRRGSVPEEWVQFQAIEEGEVVHQGDPPEDLLTDRQVQ